MDKGKDTGWEYIALIRRGEVKTDGLEARSHQIFTVAAYRQAIFTLIYNRIAWMLDTACIVESYLQHVSEKKTDG